jgi:subtilase family serine protease
VVPTLAMAALVTQAAVVTPAAQADGAATVERRVHRPQAVSPDATGAPTGLSPAQVKQAYGFPTGASAGAGQKVAVVAPFDAPTIEADLGVFSQKFGLPACTTANGCFKKVAQNGGKTYPAADKQWAMEISMDVEWVHAIAPGAKILLVEARSDRLADVVAAEDYATAHAGYVTNSFGISEFAGQTVYDSHFSRSGVSIFVASGDDGASDGPGYPASAPGVIAVGATTLANIGQPTFAEQGWHNSGGGCSRYESASAAQRANPGYAAVGCAGRRAVPDVALVGDPRSGVSVYDSYRTPTSWFLAGGTSASAPMWAARAAVSGLVITPKMLYSPAPPITFRDITAGNNGEPALPGYDLVTGLGSWTGATP